MAQAWKQVVTHARNNESTYKRFERDHFFFYTCLLDELHRHTQTFIHSGADELVSSLKWKIIDFTNILESIENFTYFVRTPAWAKSKRKQEIPVPLINNPAPLNKRPRASLSKGDLVYNPNVHPDMKVPPPATYHILFAPEFIFDLKRPCHADGSELCSNWHHNGRCRSKCPRITSHSKNLTATDIAKAREFMLKAFGRWSAKHNPTSAVVPPGNPPASNKNASVEPGK